MAAQAAVQISSPYFNPYMLGELQFSYSIYVIVVCTAIVAKIVFLPTVGRIADRVGVRRVFWISAAAIVPSSALWMVSNDYGYLIAIQLYSGVAWCASTWPRCCCSSKRFRGRSGLTCWPTSTWRTPRPRPAVRYWARGSWPSWGRTTMPT